MEGKCQEIRTHLEKGGPIDYCDESFDSRAKGNDLTETDPFLLPAKATIKNLLEHISKDGEKAMHQILDCFEELLSINEVANKWQNLYSDVCQLISACMKQICNFQTCQRCLKRVCYIISNLAECGHPLSSSLFNFCASDLLTLSLNALREEHKELLLSTLCELSMKSDQNHIFETFRTMDLNPLAKMIESLSVESQSDTFLILLQSLSNYEEACKRSLEWFQMLPGLPECFQSAFHKQPSEKVKDLLDMVSQVSRSIHLTHSNGSESLSSLCMESGTIFSKKPPSGPSQRRYSRKLLSSVIPGSFKLNTNGTVNCEVIVPEKRWKSFRQNRTPEEFCSNLHVFKFHGSVNKYELKLAELERSLNNSYDGSAASLQSMSDTD